MFPFPIFSPVGRVTIVLTKNDVTTTSDDPKTWAASAIGTYTADRVVVVAETHMGASVSADSVTIGGIAATNIQTFGAIGGTLSSLWYAVGVAGTTADIVINYSSSSGTRNGIAVWALYGAVAAPTASNKNESNPPSITLAVPERGCVLAYACDADGTSWGAWSAGITEQFDQLIAGAYTHSAAHQEISAAVASLVITPSSGSATAGMIAAAWRPS